MKFAVSHVFLFSIVNTVFFAELYNKSGGNCSYTTKAMTADLEQQRKKLMDKLAARKRQTEEKESEEIKAAQLILLSESRQKKQKESSEKERSQQSSEVGTIKYRVQAGSAHFNTHYTII